MAAVMHGTGTGAGVGSLDFNDAAVVPDMYSNTHLDTASHANELLNYNTDLIQMYDDLPDLGCLELPSPAIQTSHDMFKILEAMGTGTGVCKQQPKEGSSAVFMPRTASVAVPVTVPIVPAPPALAGSSSSSRSSRTHAHLRSDPFVTHTLAYPVAGMPTPPTSPGQSDAEASSSSSDDDEGEGEGHRSFYGDDAAMDHAADESDITSTPTDSTSPSSSSVPCVPQQPEQTHVRTRASLRPRRVKQEPEVSKAAAVLRTAKDKVQFKKRRGWKCTPEYLLDNITGGERDKLIRKGMHIPKQSGSRGPALTKAKERLIRKELRKIRNVASAQRHRLEQKEYIEELEGNIHEQHASMTRLELEVMSLRTEQTAWAAERSKLLTQLKDLAH